MPLSPDQISRIRNRDPGWESDWATFEQALGERLDGIVDGLPYVFGQDGRRRQGFVFRLLRISRRRVKDGSLLASLDSSLPQEHVLERVAQDAFGLRAIQGRGRDWNEHWGLLAELLLMRVTAIARKKIRCHCEDNLENAIAELMADYARRAREGKLLNLFRIHHPGTAQEELEACLGFIADEQFVRGRLLDILDRDKPKGPAPPLAGLPEPNDDRPEAGVSPYDVDGVFDLMKPRLSETLEK